MKRFKWVVMAAGMLLIGAAVAVYQNPPAALPQHLTGHWITKAPHYADRFLQLEPKTLVLGIGGQSIDVYFITGLKATPLSPGRTLYNVDCEDS